MPKFNLLLLDSVIVIRLHALSLWSRIVDLCDVHITQSVVDECKFYEDVDGLRHKIDLTPFALNKRITVHNPPASSIDALLGLFGPDILEKLDPGELDSLTVLYSSLATFTVCSADKIVFRVLGAMTRSDQSVSLEEVLNSIGLTQANMPYMYTKAYRVQWCKRGFEDGIKGLSSLGRQIP